MSEIDTVRYGNNKIVSPMGVLRGRVMEVQTCISSSVFAIFNIYLTRLHFVSVRFISNSVKCPCNVIHGSVTIICTSLLLIIIMIIIIIIIIFQVGNN